MSEKIRADKRYTVNLAMNWGTILSFTNATVQPPHPAPVSLAPRAPLFWHTFTSSSNSGQLIYMKQGKIISDGYR